MKGITILIILFIIALIIIFVLAALLIYTERKVSLFDDAFSYSVTNTSQCNQTPSKCQSYNSNPPLPTFEKSYSNNIAKFVGQAIVNLSNDVYNGVTEKTLTVPQGLTLITTLNTDYDTNPIIGYIAVDQVNNIQYIIFRGTLTDNEWYQDFQISQTSLTNNIMIHSGFYGLYQQFEPILMKNLISPNIIIAGHSLGGALASVSGFNIINSGRNAVIYTFGKPRVGNIEYASLMNQSYPNSIFRVENDNDLIPTIPLSATANESNPPVPWVYQHEGTSVRFNQNWGSLGLNHSMTNYLTFINSV